MRKRFVVAVVAGPVLLAVPAASAKDFRPGDVRVCNAARCVPIVNRSLLPQLTSFYYNGSPPVRRPQPTLGTPYYELRYRNGYVTGIVATPRLARFLSYGVHDQRFDEDVWYRLPRRLSVELRRLAVGLRPLRLTRAALAKSR
jgi:hypothetical protein